MEQLKVIHAKPKDIVIEPGMVVSCERCEKEFGLNQQSIVDAVKGAFGEGTISHKICLSHIPHAVSIFFGNKEPFFSQKVAKTQAGYIERFNANNGKDEARDLNRPENKELLDWYKNPTSEPLLEQ